MNMDKKKLTIVSVLGALIVVLVCIVVFSAQNEERLTKNQVLRINDTVYEVAELNKYMYLTNEDDGDISKELDESGKNDIVESFVQTKIYATAADKKSILFPDEELTSAKEEYAEKAEELAKYGITEEDYVKYVEENYKMRNLTNNFGTYYELPEDVYNTFVEYYSGDDLTTYSYRMMNFRYEEPEEDESGDEIITNTDDEEDRSKDTVLAKAQAALNAVKNGDDFETVAEEYADGTYTISQNSLVFLNGEIQYAIKPVLESKLGSTELYEAVNGLNSGDYTDIIEVADSTSYYFVKVENIEEGFVGEAAEEVKEELLYQYQETLLLQDLDYEVNQSALMKFLYK